MKLNYDCIRDVMLYIEENQAIDTNGRIKWVGLQQIINGMTEKYDSGDIVYSVKQLGDSQLLKLKDISDSGGANYIIGDITPQGHEFINNTRSPKIWKLILEKIKPVESVGLPLIVQLGGAFIQRQLGL